jgi:hypothetical protein
MIEVGGAKVQEVDHVETLAPALAWRAEQEQVSVSVSHGWGGST